MSEKMRWAVKSCDNAKFVGVHFLAEHSMILWNSNGTHTLVSTEKNDMQSDIGTLSLHGVGGISGALVCCFKNSTIDYDKNLKKITSREDADNGGIGTRISENEGVRNEQKVRQLDPSIRACESLANMTFGESVVKGDGWNSGCWKYFTKDKDVQIEYIVTKKGKAEQITFEKVAVYSAKSDWDVNMEAIGPTKNVTAKVINDVYALTGYECGDILVSKINDAFDTESGRGEENEKSTICLRGNGFAITGLNIWCGRKRDKVSKSHVKNKENEMAGGEYVFSGSKDCIIRIWALGTAECLVEISALTSPVVGFRFFEAETEHGFKKIKELVVCIGKDNSVAVISLMLLRALYIIPPLYYPVSSATLSSEKKELKIVCSDDSELVIELDQEYMPLLNEIVLGEDTAPDDFEYSRLLDHVPKKVSQQIENPVDLDLEKLDIALLILSHVVDFQKDTNTMSNLACAMQAIINTNFAPWAILLDDNKNSKSKCELLETISLAIELLVFKNYLYFRPYIGSRNVVVGLLQILYACNFKLYVLNELAKNKPSDIKSISRNGKLDTNVTSGEIDNKRDGSHALLMRHIKNIVYFAKSSLIVMLKHDSQLVINTICEFLRGGMDYQEATFLVHLIMHLISKSPQLLYPYLDSIISSMIKSLNSEARINLVQDSLFNSEVQKRYSDIVVVDFSFISNSRFNFDGIGQKPSSTSKKDVETNTNDTKPNPSAEKKQVETSNSTQPKTSAKSKKNLSILNNFSSLFASGTGSKNSSINAATLNYHINLANKNLGRAVCHDTSKSASTPTSAAHTPALSQTPISRSPSQTPMGTFVNSAYERSSSSSVQSQHSRSSVILMKQTNNNNINSISSVHPLSGSGQNNGSNGNSMGVNQNKYVEFVRKPALLSDAASPGSKGVDSMSDDSGGKSTVLISSPIKSMVVPSQFIVFEHSCVYNFADLAWIDDRSICLTINNAKFTCSF
ncbi:hypothetical protein AX774_g129 [Zancudomyces culisetae]|uniref:Uncharacterized protein n=1 Tax=Zancudomyces culisetae TaxID=1213189 RepID=A0A1R1PZ50_ZANCU|nr:hypothetical protein AX774_g129 [Zancudomyces culisetae]|eukprot:OMH86238.1 hypothetical protein AX774_g129 [Zancudomyces culisetae]